MVDAVAATAAAANGQASTDAKALANDFDDFLVLLTTQLQYQDPLDPTDSSEFTNQLVAFANVEQQIKQNDNLEALAALTALNNVGSAVNYLGQEALIESPFGDHEDAGINWQYTSSSVPSELTLEVYDDNDNLVYSQEGDITLGIHSFDWDGVKTNGEVAEPGTYQLKVTSTNADGSKIDTGIAVRETVTGVDTSGLEPYFTVGPNLVAQSNILQLLTPQ